MKVTYNSYFQQLFSTKFRIKLLNYQLIINIIKNIYIKMSIQSNQNIKKINTKCENLTSLLNKELFMYKSLKQTQNYTKIQDCQMTTFLVSFSFNLFGGRYLLYYVMESKNKVMNIPQIMGMIKNTYQIILRWFFLLIIHPPIYTLHKQ